MWRDFRGRNRIGDSYRYSLCGWSCRKMSEAMASRSCRTQLPTSSRHRLRKSGTRLRKSVCDLWHPPAFAPGENHECHERRLGLNHGLLPRPSPERILATPEKHLISRVVGKIDDPAVWGKLSAVFLAARSGPRRHPSFRPRAALAPPPTATCP